MSRDFLAVELAPADGFEPRWRSPLERALRDAPPGIRDLSRTGKLHVHGDVGAPPGVEVVRVAPDRALVLCAAADVERVRGELGERVVDMSAALAGLEVRGERLMRRLADLDLDALPAAGAVAHVPATVLRDGDAFRIFFPQEYADHVGAVVLDAAAGLA